MLNGGLKEKFFFFKKKRAFLDEYRAFNPTTTIFCGVENGSLSTGKLNNFSFLSPTGRNKTTTQEQPTPTYTSLDCS